jgi:hypothetical protein
MGYAVVKRGWLRSPVMGDIVDIGMGGMSFRYIAKGKSLSKPSHIDILLTDGSFHLDRVPLDTSSWDFETDSETSVRFPTKRCGVKFGDLTDNQKSALRYFIQFHTTADPEA